MPEQHRHLPVQRTLQILADDPPEPVLVFDGTSLYDIDRDIYEATLYGHPGWWWLATDTGVTPHKEP